MKELRPFGKNVVMERDEPEEKKTPGGIVIPAKAGDFPMACTVVAVGSEVENVAPGDRVIVGKFSGVDVPLDDKKFLITKEEDILAALVETKPAE
jgi:chaperonin GroES